MLPCSVHEASAGAVSVWRVVRLQCSVRVASAVGVRCYVEDEIAVSRPHKFKSGWRFSLFSRFLGDFFFGL